MVLETEDVDEAVPRDRQIVTGRSISGGGLSVGLSKSTFAISLAHAEQQAHRATVSGCFGVGSESTFRGLGIFPGRLGRVVRHGASVADLLCIEMSTSHSSECSTRPREQRAA